MGDSQVWLLKASQNFHLFLSSSQKASIHQPKSISHELLSSQDTAHEYGCVCLEDKIVKQMGSIVAYRNPAHMPSRKCLKLFYSCILFQHGFSTQEMVEKSVFLVDVFASVFLGTHVWNHLLNETQPAALCKNQRYGLSLRSQLLLWMPVSCLQKRMVCDDFSFHPSLSSTSSRSPPAFSCYKIAPNFLLNFLPVSKKKKKETK